MAKLACLYCAEEDAYKNIRDSLELYVDKFKFEEDVRPYMLTYRECKLYIVDLIGMCNSDKHRIMDRLPGIMRSRSLTVFCPWNNDTWKALQSLDPDCVELDNCVNGDRPDWPLALSIALRGAERRFKDASQRETEE